MFAAAFAAALFLAAPSACARAPTVALFDLTFALRGSAVDGYE
eukprot:gene10987-9598_t